MRDSKGRRQRPPNPKPTLVSLSISSHVCSLGLVLPLQRTDEIHISNPSWMQSPSYEEAWNEPHIWLPRNLGLILRCFLVQMKVAFGGVDSVSQPPRQPDRSNEQTGTSNALAFPVRRRRPVSTPRHFVLPESVLLLRTPLSPLQPNPKPTLVSLSISSHVCSLGLVLPLQRTDEIHISNPSWMQSPSYEEAWNEPHICVCKASKKLRIDSQMFSCADESCFWSCGFCSKSTQKGVTECSCCWSNFTSKGLLCAKRQKMLEDMEKDFEDKLDGRGGSKSSGSLDIRFRVEKVQAPLCDWKTARLEYSL
ncbi:hypothetical protein F2Q69_00034691 [Brassica cretica]|uniref:Uncharacterized protein n=1 Tax=Brassica cretica TaxID=69181 RepID=A0A8S9SDI6_BRACR|nr:hypothetical protein F2Q69_00034691 [Brassica cretica]